MDGLLLKGRIISVGLKCWAVARETGIHPTRLSNILNNFVDPNSDELRRIETVITRAEAAHQKQEGAKP